MQYAITFLEGIISFISPCMLPLLPVYISYFAAGADKKQHIFARSVAFVLGFTTVFSLLGLFAGTLGAFLAKYQTAVNIASGALVILFGLVYLEVIPLPFLRGMQGAKSAGSVVSAFLFGMVYSISLTPCVGAFLGSALALASSSGTAARGMALLLLYSLGLGIPFVISAVLIEKLGSVFGFIKRHYRVINIVCGVFLIIVGLLMAFGMQNRLMAMFS